MTSNSMDKIFIGISGLIGAGKSTLAKTLGEHLGLDVYYEPVEDNEYLSDFYLDIKRYSFPMQIYLLNRRFHQHQTIIWHGKGGVQDRTIYEDTVFARMLMNSGLMDPRDYRTYVNLFENMSNFMCKPNVIIYLDVKPSISLERINMRSRDIESGITLEYLEKLYEEYELFIKDISKLIPVIRVDWDTFRDVEDVARAIEEEYLNASFLRQVVKW
ncbi:MAG TPA: deoxynucleoside kinase [Myxococcales bacterium]|nr:deoxynucleoside kinase [Deltaproteobacteria bacterium]HAA58028.1 deoxynucleoside kinase [Myxococcales bacterium]|tara:strand:+ start:35171 stop:35815 length:645 start_codon:yes stop_codon:yes gene_type:complete